jgi:predicted butyrate kinase (DUF1464 family)
VTPLRVAGADPGTSSLDLVVLEEGRVADQCRLEPQQLHADPALPVRWLQQRGPFSLIAGPSGYGLPLVPARQATQEQLALVELVRPDARVEHSLRECSTLGAVSGFSALIRALTASTLPIVFLPGVVHLPTVPSHRKINRIDLGTPDKLCVAALALATSGLSTFCVVELGTVFTACLVVRDGCIVDGLGGTSGPLGWGSGGAWDGEVAYLLSPLSKQDLFRGGAGELGEPGRRLLRESLVRAVAGLRALTPFDHILLSGRLLQREPELASEIATDLERLGRVGRVEGLPGAWVKEAAQGAALLAGGLAGGRHADLVERLALRQASGSILDGIHPPRIDDIPGRARLQS